MRITLVAAIAEDGVIGRDGGLPWRLSSDLRRFKATTMGKPVIMGRKTWESIPRRPLPGRLNIVVTRNPGYPAEGAEVARSLAEALARADAAGANEAFVIGGGEIFSQAMPLADRLDVTHVLARIGGDTRFPVIDAREWVALAKQDLPAGEMDSHPTRHVIYERKIP